jgi:hypothetical protein
MGAPPPTGTLPTMIWRETRRTMGDACMQDSLNLSWRQSCR